MAEIIKKNKLILKLFFTTFFFIFLGLIFASKIEAINVNTINSDALSNTMPSTFSGAEGYGRAVYVTSTGELVYLQCLNEICTTSNRTVLNSGSGGTINNGNVKAVQRSDSGIRIFYIFTPSSGASSLRQINCAADSCGNFTSVYTFASDQVFGSFAMDVALNSSNQARFIIGLLQGGFQARLFYYYCSADCGTLTQNATPLQSFNSALTVYKPSITVNSAGNALVLVNAYFTSSGASARYIQCTSADCVSRAAPVTVENYGGSGITVDSIGQTDIFIRGTGARAGFPVMAFTRTINGVLETKFLDCADLVCSAGATNTSLGVGVNMPQIFSLVLGNMRLYYQKIGTPNELRYFTCTAVTCAGAASALIEANNSSWYGAYIRAFLDWYPQAIYNSDPGGGVKLRKACGYDGAPPCPSPDIQIFNAVGGASPPVTHAASVNVNVATDFTFIVKNTGPEAASATTVRVDAPGSTLNPTEYFAIPALASGASSSLQTFSARWSTTGAKTVTFTADNYFDVTESDETNNSVARGITVTTPGVVDYSVTIAPALKTVSQGKKASYTVTLQHITGPLPYAVSLSTNNLSAYNISLVMGENLVELDSLTPKTVNLDVFTSDNTPLASPNPYTITITGDNGGGVIKNGTAKIGVIKYVPGGWTSVDGPLGGKGDVILSGATKKAVFEANSDDGAYVAGNTLCVAIECDKVSTGGWRHSGCNLGTCTSSGYVRFDTSSLAGAEVVSVKLIMTYKNKYIGSLNSGSNLIYIKQDIPADCCDIENTETSFPITTIQAMPADAQHVITGLSTDWVEQGSAGDGWTRYVFRPSLSVVIGSSAWFNYYEREDGATFSPKLEVEYKISSSVKDIAMVQGSAIGFQSAKGWLIENYSALEEDSNIYTDTNPDSYYDYMWQKFGASRAVTLSGSGSTSICTSQTDTRGNGHPNFGYTSYGFKSYGAGTNGAGNAGNCVLANPRIVAPSLTYTGQRIDNGVFVFNGDLTWAVANSGNCPAGSSNGAAGNGSCSNYSYIIPSGNPTVIFVTGNLFIAKPIRTQGDKKFVFIVKNDSNNDGQVDTDDAVQVDPKVSADSTGAHTTSIAATIITDGIFNSASWLNNRNQTRADKMARLEQQLQDYKLATGNYPVSPAIDTSTGCSTNGSSGWYWYKQYNGAAAPNPDGVGPPVNGSWGAATGQNPCPVTTSLRYYLGAGLPGQIVAGTNWPAAIPNYTGVDINALVGTWGADLRDPTNGGSITGKAILGTLGRQAEQRFALRYLSYTSPGGTPATAYSLFFTYEDDLGGDRWHDEPDPEWHICGGDYNYHNSGAYLNSAGWVGGHWPRVAGEGSYCYVEQLVVKGGVIAQGGVKLNRDLRDDNASAFDSAIVVGGSANPHPPTAAESFITDPSFLWLFAREIGGNKSFLGEEIKSYKEEQP